MARPLREIDPERGRRLNKVIKASGMSKEKAASELGLAPGSLDNILYGSRSLTEATAEEAAALFGVRKDYLLNDSPFMTDEEITGHSFLPLVKKVYDTMQREKALKAYLEECGFLIRDNDEELAEKYGICSLDDWDETKLETLTKDDHLYCLFSAKDEAQGYCSMEEYERFRSQIEDFVEYSINKLMNGGFKNG